MTSPTVSFCSLLRSHHLVGFSNAEALCTSRLSWSNYDLAKVDFISIWLGMNQKMLGWSHFWRSAKSHLTNWSHFGDSSSVANRQQVQRFNRTCVTMINIRFCGAGMNLSMDGRCFLFGALDSMLKVYFQASRSCGQSKLKWCFGTLSPMAMRRTSLLDLFVKETS